MNVLLAPPRSGSCAAESILRILHPDIEKCHYVKEEQGWLIFDSGLIRIHSNKISNLYYQYRMPLECAASYALFDKFETLQSTETYRQWINSSKGIHSLLCKLEKYFKFGINVFNGCDVSNKMVLHYDHMIHSVEEYVKDIPEEYLSNRELKREELIKTSEIHLNQSYVEKSQSSGDSRLLSKNNISAIELLNIDSLVILKAVCRDSYLDAINFEIDSNVHRLGENIGTMVDP
jgi:hypothetical protein